MEALKIGRYEANELDIEVYHADKTSVSRSTIMAYDKCPRKYQALYLTHEIEKEVTKPMILGSAFHTYILERDKFDQRYAVLPEKVLLKDVGRDLYDAYNAECDYLKRSGKTIIDSDAMSAVFGMEKALSEHKKAAELVWGGKPIFERSYIYGDDDSGLIVKSRPDILRENCIVDFKTCAFADDFSFSQSMLKNGNHIQGAMVQDGLFIVDGREDARTLPVVNIAIEVTPPHCIGIYFISQDSIEAGRIRYKAVLKRMKASFESGVYPSYETKEISLPRWYSNSDEDF